MVQTTIPTPGKPQVSVLAALKVVFGEKQAAKIWRDLAANPGRDIVAEVPEPIFELLNRMKCATHTGTL